MALSLTACVTTRNNGPDLSGAELAYNLPETSAKARLDVVVLKCADYDSQTGAFIKNNIAVRPTAFIDVSADSGTRSEDQYKLTGAALSSWTQSRDVAVELYPTGAVKSVNSTAADRTAAVVTNILKGVATFIPLVGASGQPPVFTCTPATLEAARQVELLERHADALRASLAKEPNPKRAAETGKAIEAIVAEIGRARASEALHAEIPGTAVDLGKTHGTIDWPAGALRKLFQGPDNAKVEGHFAVEYCVAEVVGADPEAKCAKGPQSADRPPPGKADCGSDANCSRTLVLREPVPVLLSLLAVGDGFPERQQQKVIKAATLPATQWGHYSYLSFAAGGADSRTIKLTLDEYGRKTSLGWKSDAKAETLTGGAASALEAATAVKKASDGQSVASMKAEIEDLETQQKLNKLLACKEIILAGGYTCPE
jgi:hypothetical protein